MLVVVNTVSALVHVYSIGYMHHDPHRPRFFAYLSLFTFAMLMLVTSDNLVQMFFGWEGVGLASYLLIGFWYKKPSANAAAIKAFVVNRVGDFGFALGIFGVFVLFGSVEFETIFANAAPADLRLMRRCGAELPRLCARQAVGCHGRLPAAVHGRDGQVGAVPAAHLAAGRHGRPDPGLGAHPCRDHGHRRRVHGGAPVAAVRAVETALTFVTIIGAITAFFAATVGLVQNDIKRVIAYSTCSQLGYMFVALGVGAYLGGIFHLFTHAFFKALLFLGAGSVIHAVSDEQDMRNMGGLRKLIPYTYWMMIIGTLALTGVGIPGTMIGTAGFFSKDAIIEGAFVAHNAVQGFAFIALVVAAMFTSFYSWRLIFMTFHGKPRARPTSCTTCTNRRWSCWCRCSCWRSARAFAGLRLPSRYFIGDEYAEFWKGALFTAGQPHPARVPPRAAAG